VHTSVWIVNKCLKGDLVRGRTVLLVTHNVTLTAPIADFVVSLGADGRILASGPLSETVLKDKALAEQVAHEQAALELEEELEEGGGDDTKKGAGGAKLVVAEEIQRGHVSWKAITLFLGTLSGWPVVFWAAYLGGQWCDKSLAMKLDMTLTCSPIQHEPGSPSLRDVVAWPLG
jgi:hypothetical protein